MVKNKTYSGLLLTRMSDFLRHFTTKNSIRHCLELILVLNNTIFMNMCGSLIVKSYFNLRFLFL